METIIFDGRTEAQKIKEELKKAAAAAGLKPRLAVVLVGNNPASVGYIKQKKKACENLGFGFELHHLPETASFDEIKRQLLIVNSQLSIDGLILQLPIPRHLASSTDALIQLIDPAKDIDGLTPNSPFTPPTALAVLQVLKSSSVSVEGAQIAVLGRGPTAGRPVADLLRKNGAEVSVIHSQTPLSTANDQLSTADIIVSCVGRPNLIKGNLIKEGAVVIGVGISQLLTVNSQLKIVGDLDEPSLTSRASLVTPTPGGIGPLTVAFLLKNLFEAEKMKQKA